MAEAQKYLNTLRDAARSLDGIRILVGSNLKYAFGIEHGYRFSNPSRKTRKAGGVFMLTRAVASVQAGLITDLRKALDNGGSVFDVVYKWALQAEKRTKDETPVVTGTLRRSFHTVVERK